jgi:uncharacterized membrane protein YfcA
LYPLRLTQSRLITTDIVHAIPLAIVAGVGHLIIGNVNFLVLFLMSVGPISGVAIGAKISSRLPSAFLRMFLSVVLIAVSLKILY